MKKKKVAFALIMGLITTGIISLTIILVTTDLTGMRLLTGWFRSWKIAYVIVIPCILIISPLVEKLINKILK